MAQLAGAQEVAEATARGQARLRISADPAAVAALSAVPVADREHHITVNVTRPDTSVISGPVTIKGVPAVASTEVGDVDWQVSGSKVTGSVRHAANATTTTFEGTLTADGASGTFTLPSGARGQWSWDAPLPQ
jgi:hypothetical protein